MCVCVRVRNFYFLSVGIKSRLFVIFYNDTLIIDIVTMCNVRLVSNKVIARRTNWSEFTVRRSMLTSFPPAVRHAPSSPVAFATTSHIFPRFSLLHPEVLVRAPSVERDSRVRTLPSAIRSDGVARVAGQCDRPRNDRAMGGKKSSRERERGRERDCFSLPSGKRKRIASEIDAGTIVTFSHQG